VSEIEATRSAEVTPQSPTLVSPHSGGGQLQGGNSICSHEWLAAPPLVLETLGIGCTRPTDRPPHSLQEYDEWTLADGVAYDSAVLNKKAKHSQCSGVYWLSTQGKWHMVFRFQYSSVHEVTEPKADGGFGVDVVKRLIYYGASKALKLPAVYLEHHTDSESEACMAWDYCLGNARLLGLHSPQHYPNPIGRYNFGTSRQQFHESNYDDVTYVEYHSVLPVELHSRLHERCAELLFARGVMW
jgi:hypothetical protein